MQQNKLCSLTTSPQDVDICIDILYLLLLYDFTLGGLWLWYCDVCLDYISIVYDILKVVCTNKKT